MNLFQICLIISSIQSNNIILNDQYSLNERFFFGLSPKSGESIKSNDIRKFPIMMDHKTENLPNIYSKNISKTFEIKNDTLYSYNNTNLANQ